MTSRPPTVAMLTSGGLAPCLSSSVASLVQYWGTESPQSRLIGYRFGYAGLLSGDSVEFDDEMRHGASRLHRVGGSPLGNSRVKLSNAADCARRGLVKDGEDPLEVAAAQLVRDRVDVLHAIGGDDTISSARELVHYVKAHGHELVVVALPKTIDNDVAPLARTLGADTAAKYSARYGHHVVSEHSASRHALVVHEVMGRHCGWLTAEAARRHLEWVDQLHEVPSLLDRSQWDLHGVLLPEMAVDVDALATRLEGVMDRVGCVNLFVAEGALVDAVATQRRRDGIDVPVDAFGHPKLDTLNVGRWVADELSDRIGAERSVVVKSGYYARSARANDADRDLIDRSARVAVRCALQAESGVVGLRELDGAVSLVDFDEIEGGKHLDVTQPWVREVLERIEQA